MKREGHWECPFCGGLYVFIMRALEDGDWQVNCQYCHRSVFGDSMRDAKKKWKTYPLGDHKANIAKYLDNRKPQIKD